MVGLWKHIHRLNFGYFISYIKQGKVSRLRCTIATYIYYLFGGYLKNFSYYILVHTFERRDGENHIRSDVFYNKSVF